MNRERRSILTSGLFGLLLLTGAPVFASSPNIVFIMADDLGWGDVGFHDGNAPTPHLDRLSRESLELTQHYVAPVCSPTRTGLLTGRYWSRFGVTTPTNDRVLSWDTVTLPRALKTCGYETCITGKWHLGSNPAWGPNHFGFDHSFGSLAGGVTSWTHRYKVGPFSHTWHRNETLLDEQGHVTDLITREAVQWLEQRVDRPFFLYVPFTAVHLPINEPQKWVDQVPAAITSDIARQYAACVMHLDAAIGKILATLQRRGLRENTLVVFTSDNGGSWATNNTQPYPPDDSLPGKLTASNGSLRGQKGSVYEGGIRVPTLVSWPGKLAACRESTAVSIVDWMPTFCKLAGFSGQAEVSWDGVDLSEMLFQRNPLGERSIYVAGPGWQQMAFRQGPWKLVSLGDSMHELYRLDEDPGEQTNLAAAQPERLEQMLRDLQVARQRDNDAVVD